MQLLCDWDSLLISCMFLGAIFGIISKAKSEGITAKEYSDLNSHKFDRKDIAKIYIAYEEELQLNNLVVRIQSRRELHPLIHCFYRILTTC